MVNGMYEKPVFRTAGDRGLLVEYGDAIDPAINRKVRSVAIAMERESINGVLEFIPTYRSIIIIYCPSLTHPAKLMEAILSLEDRISEIEIPPPETVEIPVCYGGEHGPDIGFVADSHALKQEEVVQIHSEPAYQIYMIGFTPGFPFLGGLSQKLYTPRLQTPRTRVPAGSVGIAKNQTGIYSIDSPGGWQLIGRTPFNLFDSQRRNPFLFKAGDLLKFKPISPEEYDRLKPSGGN
jgi:KipI family sensor histidine kinase inhibitor